MPTVKIRLVAEIEAADRAEAERKLDAFRDATMPSLHYGILLHQQNGEQAARLDHERNVAAERGLTLREHLLADLRTLLLDLRTQSWPKLESAAADLDEKQLADAVGKLAHVHELLGLS